MPRSARTPITTPTAIPAIAPLLRPDDELDVLDGVADCAAADMIAEEEVVEEEVADVDADEDVVEVAVDFVDIDDVVDVAAASDDDQAAAAL
ncbi:hypothetical protein F66182_16107 [Fusarium sp. NRRL 66182]|nr:hypothetical protein F66182_16107 [Fusarium sp. NRRL 66182]